MRILPDEKRPVSPMPPTVITDGLGNGQNMGFGKRAGQGGAAMAARAEADELIGILQVRRAFIVGTFESG